LDLAEHVGGDGRVTEAGTGEGGVCTAFGGAGAAVREGSRPGWRLVPGVQRAAQLG
jgi:hypothetical protein